MYNYYMNQMFLGAKPELVLKKVFGYENFRPLQKEIISNVLSYKDTLAIMPTGGGKSICYQIPSLIFDGITVVVSPLIALMQDQVAFLKEMGVAAIFLNSSLEWKDYLDSMNKIRSGQIRIVYVSPEGLGTEKIRNLFSNVKVSCLTIDEAHCVSQWGHDFRPDYLEISSARRLFPDAVCLALTATATKKVQEDIQKNLSLKEPKILVSSFDRPNIFLDVRTKRDGIRQVTDCIRTHYGESGIIYCFSKKGVDELCEKLNKLGFNALNYHAGLSQKERFAHQEKFLNDEVQIMVATVAFGMGINKPNVRFVIHYDLPKSIEQYYQEIGRAGRDGLPSTALLLYSSSDIRKIKFLLQDSVDAENANRLLSEMVGYAEARRCRRKVVLNYFGEKGGEIGKNCCDMCRLGLSGDEDDGETEGKTSEIGMENGSNLKNLPPKKKTPLSDVTIPSQKLMSCIIRTGMRFGANYVINVLLGKKEKKIIDNGHNMLSTWNIGKELSKDDWKELVFALIEKGFIVKTNDDYGVLKLTNDGVNALKNRDKIEVLIRFESFVDGKFKEKKAERSENKSKSDAGEKKPKVILHKKISPVPEDDKEGQEIQSNLKAWRTKTAKENSVPPYIIFGDRTLFDIAMKKPKSESELFEISGLGEKKIQNFGEKILEIVLESTNSQE